jgi:uncharacterized membrane protein
LHDSTSLYARVARWTEAGIIDPEGAARILAFEASQEHRATLRWPVLLAMIFGAILLAAGVTLFVAAHWDRLSPLTRYSLVLAMVAGFHVAGAFTAQRFPVLSTTLRAVGTGVLGPAIYLTAQIFNLHENWPTGMLLWAVGAAAGSLLFRDPAHISFVAILVPAWLVSEWALASEGRLGGTRAVTFGVALAAICYLSARVGEQQDLPRRALAAIGAIGLLPSVGTAIGSASVDKPGFSYDYNHFPPLPGATLLVCWAVALLAPLALAWLLRGRAAWMNLLWAGWLYALIVSADRAHLSDASGFHHRAGATLALYILCAAGSVAMAAWGLYEKRKERVNLGVAAFAISVLFFYFDSFMDKLGRAASLLVLGIICIAGGYALEKIRRKLTARMEVSE